jgi:transposase
MRPPGSPQELERRRKRAVQAIQEGSTTAEVARVLGVADRSVCRWVAAARDGGDEALDAVVHPGPKPKLNGNQQRQVLSWLKRPPSEFGFATELWTAPRVAHLIRERLGVEFHPRYINEWLARRGITPQKPETQARERDARQIAAWRSRAWPRLKKRRARRVPTSS